MKKLVVVTVIATMSMSTLGFAGETSAVVTSNNVATTQESATAVNPLAVIDEDTHEVLVPAKSTAEKLGYSVTLDEDNQTMTFTKGQDIFKITIGETGYVFDGSVILEASAPKVVDGVVYVSPKFVNLITPYDGHPEIQDNTGAGEQVINIAPINQGTTNTTVTNETLNNTAEVPLAIVDRDTLEILQPVRESAETFGYDIAWDQASKTITLTKGGDVFNATIGKTEYIFDGDVVLEASAPQLVNGTTYVSPKFISLITPYDGQPDIQDPTGSTDGNENTNNITPIEDPIAAAGLSDQVVEAIYSVVNTEKAEMNKKIDTSIEEYKQNYLANGGSEEDYIEPEHKVGAKFVNFTDDYFCVNVYGYSVGTSFGRMDRCMTFDKKTGELVTLEDIYGDDYDTYVKKSILSTVEANQDDYNYDQQDLDGLEITNDTSFYINSKNQLVVVLPSNSTESNSYQFIITNYSSTK